jgi:spore coat protein CotH
MRLPALLLLAGALPIATLVTTDEAASQGRGRKTKLVQEFDSNKDGWLNRQERDEARKELAKNPRGRRRGGRGGRMRDAASEPKETFEAQKPLTPGSVKHFPDVGLYNGDALRTIFIEFEDKDWDVELTAFYRTDVCVPAKMTVDGKTYANVGIRYRGNSSYSAAGKKKRSLNLITDLVDSKQKLYGYKTLNLLNCHTDPSFLREVVFSRICREYMPASKTNLVRVVINGENWGIYSNIQQINKDFTKQNYNTRKGVRWKVPPNFSGDAGLRYIGEDVAAYKAIYDLKNDNAKEPWKRLVRACYLLEWSNDKLLEDGLSSFLDVDEVLWHLALDNIFQDGDGYHSRASDYILYEDPNNRFHLLFHDNNEVMRGGGRGGPGRGRGGPGGGPRGGVADSGPLAGADREDRTLLYRMLAIPSFRARYLHHVKTIRDEWLDWNKIGPVFQKFHDLIDADVKQDQKRLYSYAAFQSSLENKGGGSSGGARGSMPIRSFIEQRRDELKEHPSLGGQWPTIASLQPKAVVGSGAQPRLHVLAQVSTDVPLDRVLLYSRDKRIDGFKPVEMKDDGKHGDGAAGDGVWGGYTPSFGAGKKIRYYVEARATAKIGTTTFHPRKAEANAHSFRFAKPTK